MSHAIYTASAESFAASLGSLAAILAQAAQREDAAKLPAESLYPDMFPLSTQVQLACFHASTGTARLMGREVSGRPSFQELDLTGLQALAEGTQKSLAALTAAEFAGADERRITMPLQPPMVLDVDGMDFLHRWLIPNFYFHYVTSYDILRHKGLAIGKRDYLAHLARFMTQTA